MLDFISLLIKTEFALVDAPAVEEVPKSEHVVVVDDQQHSA